MRRKYVKVPRKAKQELLKYLRNRKPAGVIRSARPPEDSHSKMIRRWQRK